MSSGSRDRDVTDQEILVFLGIPTCSHHVYGASVKFLENRQRVVDPPIPALSETSSLFTTIERLIKQGQLEGDEWKDELVWKESIITSKRDFSVSIRQAIKVFISNTPTFGAIHRHFLRTFPHPVEFAASKHLLTESEWKQIEYYFQNGAPRDDAMVEARLIEREAMKLSGLSGKARKAAKKKGKKAAKSREDIGEVTGEFGELDLD
jgi:hypothetical protein